MSTKMKVSRSERELIEWLREQRKAASYDESRGWDSAFVVYVHGRMEMSSDGNAGLATQSSGTVVGQLMPNAHMEFLFHSAAASHVEQKLAKYKESLASIAGREGYDEAVLAEMDSEASQEEKDAIIGMAHAKLEGRVQ